MGYIIPMCLAMSGALMSGVASAEVFLGAEFSDILEHGGSWNSDDRHRSITSDGEPTNTTMIKVFITLTGSKPPKKTWR